VLAKGVEMESIHEVDSAAQPIATDTHASDQSRSQVGSNGRRNAGTSVSRREACNEQIGACLGNGTLRTGPGRHQ
jgi:hypothetical protein